MATNSTITETPVSKPGYTTITDSQGNLVNIKTSASPGSYQTPSGGIVSYGGGGSAGIRKPKPAPKPAPKPQGPLPGLITKSTETNRPQVEAQFRQLQNDAAAEKNARDQALKKYKEELKRTANFNQLDSYQQMLLKRQAIQKANDLYQANLQAYYNNPKNIIPVPPELTGTESKIPTVQELSNQLNVKVPKGRVGLNKLFGVDKLFGLTLDPFVTKFFNTYSGGKLTNAKLDVLQQDLNKRIQNYNLQYKNKSLSPAEYQKAQKEYRTITTVQKGIDLARNAGTTKLNTIFANAKTNPGPVYKFIAKWSPFPVTASQVASIAKGEASALANFGIGAYELPSNIVNLVKTIANKPGSVTQIPRNVYENIKRAGARDLQLFKINPTAGVARVATQAGEQYVTYKITDTGLQFGKALAGKAEDAVNSLLGRYAKATEEGINIPKENLFLKGATVSEIKEPLATQAEYAGTTRPLVVNAARDQIEEGLGRGVIVRKPIPGEDLLDASTKKLLAKFDEGKISPGEFRTLQSRIVKRIGGNGLLERSMFFDPNGYLRYSRLGVEQSPTATLRDILKGNFKFRSEKPEITFLRDVKVEDFPNTPIFDTIKGKLRRGIPLNQDEITNLVKFQTTVSGKLKPIGSTTYRGGIEPELTVAPGEILQRVKKIGYARINGVKVTLLERKFLETTPELQDLLSKYISSQSDPGVFITKEEYQTLKQLFKGETGKSFRTFVREEGPYLRRFISGKPVLRIPKGEIGNILSPTAPSAVSKSNIVKISYRPQDVAYNRGRYYLGTKYGYVPLTRTQASRGGSISIAVKNYKPLRAVPKSKAPQRVLTNTRGPKGSRRIEQVEFNPRDIVRLKDGRYYLPTAYGFVRMNKTRARQGGRIKIAVPRAPQIPKKAKRLKPKRTTRPKAPIKKAPKRIGRRKAEKKKKGRAKTSKKQKKRAPKQKGKGYNVYIRPLKKKKEEKKPSLKKVKIAPLEKTRAEDLRNYLVNNDLARTARIKPTNQKAQKVKLKKVPPGYAARTKHEVRNYRIVKGKKVPLPKGEVIEKRKYLLNTKTEIKQIQDFRKSKSKRKTKKSIKPNAVKNKRKRKIPITLIRAILKASPGQTIINPTKTGKRKYKVTKNLQKKARQSKRGR